MSCQICGSGRIPMLSSRAASRVPFCAARQAAMTTSCRSPGTTISRPSSRTRTPRGRPWANTATSLIRRDRSPSFRISGFSSRTRLPTRSQVSSGRCGTPAIRRSPCLVSAIFSEVAGVVAEEWAAGRSWTTQPTTRACSPEVYPLAAIANCSARPWTPSGAGRQLPTSSTSASRARASAWLRVLAYSLDGPEPSPSTTTTSDRLQIGCQAATIFSRTTFELAFAQLPLQFGGAERFRRSQRGDRRHQRG